MLNCEQCNTLQFDYLDDLLSKEGKQELEEHLAACPVCREQMERCQKTIALIREAEYTPSRELSAGVLTGLRRQKEARRRKMLRMASTAAACVVLAIVLAVLPYVTRFTRMDSAENDAAVAPEAGLADQEAAMAPNHSLTVGSGGAASTGAARDDSGSTTVYYYSQKVDNSLADQAVPEAEEVLTESKMAEEEADSVPAEAAPQTNGLFSVYASAYCPEYADEVVLLCIGNDAAAHLGDAIDDAVLTRGANYTLYRLSHTRALAESLTDLGNAYKINCYPGRENAAYIVYVEIR